MKCVLPLLLFSFGCSPENTLYSSDDPPDVQILRPLSGSEFEPTSLVSVCAYIVDELPLERLDIVVESSVDGVLEIDEWGACEEGNYGFEIPLSEAPHVLSVSARDEGGSLGVAVVSLLPTVNTPPWCLIHTPLDGDVFREGDVVDFELSAFDLESDPASLAVTITSDDDGVIWQGPPDSLGSISFTEDGLSAANHSILVTASDVRGMVGSCTVSVEVDACVDFDGDGVTTCDGDCNDGNPYAYPGAPEILDGVDNDCDGIIDEGTAIYDDDGDGFAEVDGDCDDNDALVYPGATEIWYDGVDQDCDQASDYDQDGDGFDAAAYGGTDCLDTDALVYPLAVEVWYDGVDQDCDGWSDYDADFDGVDSDAYGGTDCDDTNASIKPSAMEVYYDGVDANCDGADDYDADGDGFASDAHGGTDCDDANPSANPGATENWYNGVDEDCDSGSDYDQDGDGADINWSAGGTDCDDLDAAVNLSAVEVWYDGVDQDCSGGSDYDQDLDGHASDSYGGGDCDDLDSDAYPGGTEVWYDGVDQDCLGGSDYDQDGDGHDSEAYSGDDCDDLDSLTNPSANETWYDGHDQDCSGGSDYDQDGDGYTVTGAPVGSADDCNDTSSSVNVGETEVWYDGLDANCDGLSDFDQDQDGQMAAAYGGADCDDTNPAISMGSTEVWYDGVDGDCDGWSDYDQDRDGYTVTGAPSGSADDCDDSASGYLLNPGVPEIWYDGVDQNCDGWSDYDQDLDTDDFDAFGGGDCNDENDTINSLAIEIRDGLDNDCDAKCDEGLIGSGDLVITEIMKNPHAVDDSLGEWFEVYNATGIDILMCSDWSFEDDGGDWFEVDTEVLIPANDYAVFVRSSNMSSNGGVSGSFGYGGNLALGNSSDELVMIFEGIEIDRVNYDSGNAFPNVVGASMELDPDEYSITANDSGTNWCSGVSVYGTGDLGTPGAENDQCF